MTLLPLSLPSVRSVRAFAWRWRLVGIAIVVAMAFSSILAAIEANTASYPIVVASRDLAAGTPLEESDVDIVTIKDHLPGVATSPELAIGSPLVTSITAGSPILERNILNDDLVTNPSPGHVISAVELADDGGLDLLHPGARVDLYAAPDEYDESSEAELVVRAVRVVGITKNQGKSTIFSEVDDKRVYFLEIPDSEVSLLLGFGARSPLHAVPSMASRGE